MKKNKSLSTAFYAANFIFTMVLSHGSLALSQDKTNTSLTKPRAVSEVSEYKPHFGLQAGSNTPEGSNRTGGEVGFDIGYQVYIPYGIGLMYSHTTFENANYDNEQRDELMAKGTYNFGGDIPLIRSSYIGLAAGASSNDGVNTLIAAPLLGFDIKIGQVRSTGISLGALAKYIIYEGDNADSTTLSGVLKFWL